MMDTNVSLIGVLLAIAILAGCSTTGQFHTVSVSPETIGVENGKFYFNGTITISSGAVPPHTYENVTIVLYNNDKQVIKRVAVGTLSSENSADRSQTIQIKSQKRPRYLVIQSPDFWRSSNNLEVQSYEYIPQQSNYQLYYQTGPHDRFPNAG